VTAAPGAGPQLPLNIRPRDDATLDNFLFTPAVAPLKPMLEGQSGAAGEPIIYLHGPAGAGKSHLLQASCHATAGGSLYLPLAELLAYPPESVLAGVESLDLVCIDDLQATQGRADWEQALFHCFNRARARGCRLLVSADRAPRALDMVLEDLRSRLSWGIVYHLPGLDDAQRVRLLTFRAGRRGLRMGEDVASYLVSRAPRDPTSLLNLLDILDQRALAEKRALTVPFVKQVMGW